MNAKLETGPGRGLSLDAKAFLMAATAGIILMSGLKLVHAPQLLITLLVASVVVIYSVAVVRLGRLHLRLDQAGDNAYYLGLVFTLASMAWALWEVGRQVTKATVTPSGSVVEVVIGDFGLALASTLAGIICRIVLHQMRLDPADVEAESRVQLARAAAGMVGQLDSLAQGFGEHTARLQQRQQDHANELYEMHRKMSDELVETVREAATASTSSIQGTTGEVTRAMDDLSRAMGSATTALTEAIERLKAVQPPPVKLSQRFDTMAAKVGSLTETLEENAQTLGQSLSRFQSLSDELEKMFAVAGDVVPAAVERIDSTRDVIRELEEAMKTAGVSAKQLEDDAARSAKAVSVVESSATEVLERLTKVVGTIDVQPVRTHEGS